MNMRYMRMIVFFDLPVLTPESRRNYTRFRKFLIKTGFIMMQESVYCKLVLNGGNAAAVEAAIRKQAPSEGLVQLLIITEKQFSRIACITGTFKTDVVSSMERTVFL